MHSVRLLLDLVSELLVEFGPLPRPGGAIACQPLGAGQPRRSDRRTAGQARGPVPPVSLPYDPELLQSLPEGAQPRKRDRGPEEGPGGASALTGTPAARSGAEPRSRDAGCRSASIRQSLHKLYRTTFTTST